MTTKQIEEERALAQVSGTRHFNRTELDGFLKGGNHLTIDAKLKNQTRSVRKYKLIWDEHFKTHFLMWHDETGKQDPLKNLNSDTVLPFINDPKREARLTVANV